MSHPEHLSSADSVDASSADGNPLDIQRQISKLEDIIFEGVRIPLSRYTLIDEEEVLDQLEEVQRSLPSAFQEALMIIRQKDAILAETEQYIQEMLAAAEQRAAHMLNQTGIVRQAEMEAAQVRQGIQQEGDAMREQILQEIEQRRQQAQQEIEQMQQMAIAECSDIQQGADEYAEQVLSSVERQLTDMVRIIHNGRQQLRSDPSTSTRQPPPQTRQPGQRYAR
ncbi:MAG: hypothetical protein ACFB5Z_14200 [Elainellaceae cyanobacterium]